MKMYTEAGNAKRAAKTLADKYKHFVEAAPAVRVPDTATPMFYAAVYALNPNEVMPTEVTDAAKVVDRPQAEAPAPAPEPTPAPAPKPKAKVKATGQKTNKSQQAIEMMSRKGGATAQELMDALDWQKHTVRGFVSLYNKKARKDGTPQIASVSDEKDKKASVHYKLG